MNNWTLYKVKSELLPVTGGVFLEYVQRPVLFTLTKKMTFHSIWMNTARLWCMQMTLHLEWLTKKKYKFTSIHIWLLTQQSNIDCHTNDLVLIEIKSAVYKTSLQNHLSGLPELYVTTSPKYLGLTLDNKLSWEPHLDKLCLCVVHWIKQIIITDVAKTAYHSIFQSSLGYGY